MKRSMRFKKCSLLILLLTCWSLAFAQVKVVEGSKETVVTGVVIEKETGLPIERVSVAVKGSSTGTTTNMKGEFSIKVPSSSAVLVFSFIGKLRQEVPVGSNIEFNVTLETDNTTLEDVVVVGYGTQKRSHLTGSVATVSMKNLIDLPTGSLSEALKGQIVGVNVSGGYSRPGEGATITIRNPVFYSKDGGQKEPLFVIDDIIRSKSDFDLLDPTEVESLTVLKDAAAAIYGILGANGVIVVKTKRGKSGVASINYNGSYGISSASLPKMMTGLEHAKYLNDFNGGRLDWNQVNMNSDPAMYTQDELDYFSTVNHNWLDMAWQTSHETRQTLNISGGSDKATFFAGFTYADQNSNFEGLGYKRYSFRSSSDIKLTTGLKLSLSLSANLSDRRNTFNKQGNESLDNDWKTLIGESPMYAPYINGVPILIPGAGTGSNINTYHYFAVHDLDNYTSSYNSGVNFQGQLSYEVPFIKGLKAAVNFNKNIANSWGKQYGTKYDVYDFNKEGGKNHILGDSAIRKYTWSNGDRVRLNPTLTTAYQLNATVNYDRTFGKHSINALFGYEQVETFADGVAGQVDGVVVGGLDNQNFATGAQASNETISEGGRMAYIGRLSYNYAGKYLFEAQFRADASERFAPENRWGYFPSFLAGWVISEENFFSRFTNTVNYLKIRGSVGFMGLDATKSYQWLRSYAIQTGKAAVFNGNTDRGLAVVSSVDMANRAVHWDNQNKFDIGIDAQFLRRRLSVSMDGYLNKNFNMLSALTSAPSILIGTPLPSENFGAIDIFGYELSATWRDNIGKNFSYNVTANFSWADNKVIKTDVAKGNIGTHMDPTGKSQDMGFYGYRNMGMFRSQADINAYVSKYGIKTMLGYTPAQMRPGMLYYEDIRGKQDPATGKYAGPDGIIDANDQDWLTKKQDNHYSLGLNWGVSYKNLSLSVVMGMNWGGVSTVEGAARKKAEVYSNRPAFWADHWAPDHVDAKYPSPYYTSTYDVATDFWWRSSTSIRVSNLNLSYSLPQNWMRSVHMNSARFYFVAINPINFYNPYSDYKDNSNGSYDVYPSLKSFVLGLNLNL